jgi:AraC-like DNA-binding protein
VLRRKVDPPRGLIAAAHHPSIAHARFEPPVDLAPFVEHLWAVSWDLERPVVRENLPHPSVHWTVDATASRIVGVVPGRFRRVLRGRGRVVSVKFRPGGFAAFTRTPMHRFTGRTVAASSVLGPMARPLPPLFAALHTGEAMLRLCDVLRALEPVHDELATRAREIVEWIAARPDVVRVAQLSERFGLPPLALQRLFRAKVGVSPKWVIQRYRLHEALERIHLDGEPVLAALAAELGFTDQAHFTRTFKAFVGTSPGRYARRARRPGG